MLLDQSKTCDDGAVHNAAGLPIVLPVLPVEDLLEEPAMRFKAGLEALNEVHAHIAEVLRDQDLSPLGREKKLRNKRESTLDLVARQIDAVEDFAEYLDRREDELLAVPRIAPTNAVEALDDRELRDYWRGLKPAQRGEILKALDAGSPDHQRLALALMRSPYAQADHEVRMLREIWARNAREANPALALEISEGRRQVEWGRRGMAQLAVATKRAIGLEPADMLRQLAAHKPATLKAFGFDAASVERLKRADKARGHA